MEYRKYDCNSYNIHTIKTDKFKTVRMEIIFSKEIKREELSSCSFLCDLLTDCSKKYKTRKDISIRLEELYKAVFYGTANKVGNVLFSSFIYEFIDPAFINEENYLEEVVSFPFEIINNPQVKNKEFQINNFNIVKNRMLKDIESIKENPNSLAINTALRTMDENSPSSFRVLGTKEDVLSITPSSLFKTYEELFLHSNCDIFIIGNANMDNIVKIIKEKFKNRVIKMSKPNLLVHNKIRKKPQKVIDKSNFVQSSLVMIYNIKDLSKKAKNIDFHVFNYIFGSGGITSKLYRNLRCDNSLCYSVKSFSLKYDGLLMIEVSLDKQNVKLAEKLIKKSLKEMLDSNYSDETLEDAKKNLIFSLKIGLDNNVSILNNYVFNIFDELPLVEERIEAIKNVKREDIDRCAKSLVLNTVYIQDAGDNNE